MEMAGQSWLDRRRKSSRHQGWGFAYAPLLYWMFCFQTWCFHSNWCWLFERCPPCHRCLRFWSLLSISWSLWNNHRCNSMRHQWTCDSLGQTHPRMVCWTGPKEELDPAVLICPRHPLGFYGFAWKSKSAFTCRSLQCNPSMHMFWWNPSWSFWHFPYRSSS